MIHSIRGRVEWIFHTFCRLFQALYLFYLLSGCLIIHMESYVILEQYCPVGYDRIFSVFLFVSGAVSFLACSLSDPGKISHTSLDKHLKFYPYDQVIFHQNNKCSTCRILKPARSKHCKYCLSCISRYDHHCFLLNNCIGGYNSIYYFVFICTNAAIAFHSFYITFRCLYNIIKYENLLKATFIHKETNEEMPNSYVTIVRYLFSKCSPTFSVFVVSLVSASLLALLFSHEIYFNFFVNITNNEKKKYVSLKDCTPVNKQFYNKGFIRNVQDVLFYKKNVEDFFKKNS
ncbi:palmitoyltransferase, putative [Plasmodium knowlesi strain H]|uniref:Palmitoyltransferase n=3 Tax=Plasmodium knowlesi TaxID=5850 RepID=A0A1A7VT14_PLAKH|nr:palmitoyltransferase DHHC12, putative [Plasmodium knowlesi strain H]OTN66545.1 Palmitoyltransferase [Plasmodium knowlesi]CAA9986820.1 palmitoyltransferase DHHC12, putative [Plasmodium knowlesi strain H]SBO23668.1 palmitoyltransferase, putative [Plasmodium knowlesi strain H]SBO25240.1 palmitoyltransferase, putative [Plasmodium knowlesi strain H]VVS76294.1 palmitoyltransferase DHHC12, putative [Plasmodium knowlesi strain H]